MGDQHPKLRGECRRLSFPVVHNRKWAEDQARPVPHVPNEMGERCRSFAEAHVVGEAAAEAKPGQKPKPPDRSPLIGPQRADKAVRLICFGQPIVRKPGHQVGEPSVRRGPTVLFFCEKFDRSVRPVAGVRLCGCRQPQQLGGRHRFVATALVEVFEGACYMPGVHPHPGPSELDQLRLRLGKHRNFGIAQAVPPERDTPVDVDHRLAEVC